MKTINGITCFSTIEEVVAPGHCGLVVVDMQNDLCRPAGHFARNGKDVGRIAGIIPRLAELIGVARERGVPVLYTQQTTLAGNASDSPAWLYFKTRDGKAPDYTLEGTWGEAIVDELAPRPDEPVIKKLRPSSFLGTSLDRLLRDRDIRTVVVAGCITQGCVQATITDASYHDYYAVLVEDCVQSTNQELHENALRFICSRYDTLTAAELTSHWRSHPGR